MTESKLDYEIHWLWKLNIKLVIVLECQLSKLFVQKLGPDGIKKSYLYIETIVILPDKEYRKKSWFWKFNLRWSIFPKYCNENGSYMIF